MAARRNDGSVSTNTARRTPAQISESACPCGSAGVWNECASDGSAIVAAASSVSVEIIRARDESNRCSPFLTPPTTNASPSTRTLFARIARVTPSSIASRRLTGAKP